MARWPSRIAVHGWKFLERKPAAAGKSGAGRFFLVEFRLQKRDRISSQLANAGAAPYQITLSWWRDFPFTCNFGELNMDQILTTWSQERNQTIEKAHLRVVWLCYRYSTIIHATCAISSSALGHLLLQLFVEVILSTRYLITTGAFPSARKGAVPSTRQQHQRNHMCFRH